jgi:hypothetical protein
MNKALLSLISRDNNGNIDIQKTKDAYRAHLDAVVEDKLLSLQEKLNDETNASMLKFDEQLMEAADHLSSWYDLIAPAVRSALPDGVRMTKVSLIGMTVHHLLVNKTIQATDIKDAEEMISRYLSENTDKLFSVIRGAKGGISRL